MHIQILKSLSVITSRRYDISYPYGQFEVCEQEGHEGLNVTYGHSKDNHPELKQVMTGILTDEYGIPIYEQTLDGNTSDSTWIKSAIHYLQNLLGDERVVIIHL
jgi:transposase